MTKTYRILICCPGGRYGQLPSETFLLNMNGKAKKFDSHEATEYEIHRIVGMNSFKIIPTKYKPTYKIV